MPKAAPPVENRAALATAPAGRDERRLAIAAVAISLGCLLILAPFARTPLAHAPTFTAAYQAALCMADLITAMLLFGQFFRLRTGALLWLASGYLFCSLLSISHALTFPGAFAPGGLLGAGPQSAAWIYVVWRMGFPVFVIAYALLSGRRERRTAAGDARAARPLLGMSAGFAMAAVTALVAAVVTLVTRGAHLLPQIMSDGDDYHRVLTFGVSPGILAFDLVALAVMWPRRRASVLDLWVIVVLVAWFCDVTLASVIDAGRYDLGWYAGRVFGLAAASAVLVALLFELNKLYARLETTLRVSERQNEELRRSREELGRVQRLEALVQLTGGVAHDFNNLLTAIIGNLDMIRRKPGDVDRVVRLSDNAATAAVRGADLIKRMLSFARRQNLRPQVLNPNAILVEFQNLAARAAGENTPVTLDLDSAVHPVRVDPTELQAAILNLITNARDAMPDGGTIRISSRNLDLAEDDAARPPEVPAGAYVRIAVADTGMGMDEATRARVFEPFFTTKPVGSGTGLGLSQVYGFAKDADGWVDVDSAPGQGAVVTVNLPRSREEVAAVAVDADAPPLRPAVAGETVLAVEDDPDVMTTTRESLTDLGYKVLTAVDARAALDILDSDARVDILFSDVVMPGGMNGAQLAVEARRLRPALKVLLTSGYAAGALGEHRIPESMPLLVKPYRREDLAQKIRLVLHADAG